jgi:predicted enzyme related to lactoylglutathione lyase
MADEVNNSPGNFCWTELSTTDAAAAKAFYLPLFGWTNDDIPIPGGAYIMLKKDGRDAGAMMENKKAPHPAWTTYVAVENADETAAKAASLGGMVLAPAFDVMDAGRMAVLSDPSGAVFALWQAARHKGFGLYGEPGSPCWFELITPETEKCETFYTQVFGWQAKSSESSGGQYTEIYLGERAIGGILKTPEGMNAPPHWVGYFAVADCDATMDQTKSTGGQVMTGPRDIPHVGRFAYLLDPQGAGFCVIKLAMG